MHEGALAGTVVTCPWHGWEFDVTSGRCNLNPKASLACYAVRVRDGMVEIRVS
ncbi:MAG: Rieske (2Fe-2S) protein [Planctomycetota bacterium]